VPPAGYVNSNDDDSCDDASISCDAPLSELLDDDNACKCGPRADNSIRSVDLLPLEVAPVFDISFLYQRVMFRMHHVEQAAKILDTHGFCVFPSRLTNDCLDVWLLAMGKVDRNGCSERDPFDGTHFSFGSCEDLPMHCFQALMDDMNLRDVVDSLLSPGWYFCSCGGDVVTSFSPSAQVLHSDWAEYPTCSMKYGYALVASIALCDVPPEFAALRVVPWSCDAFKRLPYPDADSLGNLHGNPLPLQKGHILLRDCRAAHSGMPNACDRDRILPGSPLNPSP